MTPFFSHSYAALHKTAGVIPGADGVEAQVCKMTNHFNSKAVKLLFHLWCWKSNKQLRRNPRSSKFKEAFLNQMASRSVVRNITSWFSCFYGKSNFITGILFSLQFYLKDWIICQMAVFILWSASVISWDIWFVCRIKIGFVTIWIHYLHLADTVMNDVADIQNVDTA